MSMYAQQTDESHCSENPTAIDHAVALRSEWAARRNRGGNRAETAGDIPYEHVCAAD